MVPKEPRDDRSRGPNDMDFEVELRLLLTLDLSDGVADALTWCDERRCREGFEAVVLFSRTDTDGGANDILLACLNCGWEGTQGIC